MNRAFQITGAFAGMLAIVVAGCSGGGSGNNNAVLPGTPVTPVQKSAGTGTAVFTIRTPAKTSSARRKGKPNYVSSGTGEVAFTVNGGTPTVVVLTPNTSTCPGSVAPYTCTAQANVPAGTNQQIAIATYQSTSGTVTGTPLSLTTVTETIVQNTNNPLTVTLNGVAASNLAWTPAATTITLGTPSSTNLNVSAQDASGATIIGPGCLVDANGNALSIVDTDATAHTSASCDSNTGVYTLSYDGLSSGASVIPSPTITISGTGLSTLTQKFAATSAVSDGDFSLAGTSTNSVGSPWYVCGGKHTTLTAPYSPAPTASATAQAAATAVPSPTPTGSPYAQLETAVPAGAPSPYPSNGFKSYTMVDNALATSPGSPTAVVPSGTPLPWALKYNVGICQDVTIPSGTPNLYVQVFEGGDDSFVDTDTEADLYATPAPIVSTPRPDYTLISSLPVATLFAEDNCWDSAGWENIFLSSTMLSTATGTVTGTATSRWANCPETPGSVSSAAFGSTYLSLGGYWYSKKIAIPAGEVGGTYTLFLGTWRAANSGGNFLQPCIIPGGSPCAVPTPAAEYYSYSYWTGAAIY